MKINKLIKKVKKKYGASIEVKITDQSIILSGVMDNYQDIVEVGYMFVDKKRHVVNEIKLRDFNYDLLKPKFYDDLLNEQQIDVLVIGGGIIGATILRELSKWDLRLLLIEKEADIAMGTSGANDGMIHAGIDLKKNTLKAKYCLKGNALYEQLSKELDFDFFRTGQYVVFSNKLDKALANYILLKARKMKIENVRKISKEEIIKIEPNVKSWAKGAIKIGSTGIVSPFKVVTAFIENAILNNAKVSLETFCLDMVTENGKVQKVLTNRGVLFPKIIINAAGVYSDIIAEMAEDKYYSIHPRKGTNIIFDKKKQYINTIITKFPKRSINKTHTKGGAITSTVEGNILIGPDALEVVDRNDIKVSLESINRVFNKHQQVISKLSKADIISYFSGLRAATYEEDFIVEVSRKVKNLIHVAGIQSPGLTAAPAIAIDVCIMAVDLLKKEEEVAENRDFIPHLKRIVEVKKLSLEERDKLIKQNPDYGQIICRCEEISLGEIKDAIERPLPSKTIDGIKRRVRPGMGRCQGGFCLPLILKILSDELKEDITKVSKRGYNTNIGLSYTKDGEQDV